MEQQRRWIQDFLESVSVPIPVLNGPTSTTSTERTRLKLAVLVVLLLVVVVCTRLWTGNSPLRPHRRRRPRSGSGSERAIHTSQERAPPQVPYWIPFLGHVPNLILDRNFLKRVRERYYDDGLAALTLFGTTHVFVFRHGLGTSLMSKPAASADVQWVRHRILSRGFGYPASELEDYAAMAPQWHDLYTRKLLADPGLGRMVSRTAARLTETAADFVSFGGGAWHPGSQRSQTPWERIGRASVVVPGDVVEVGSLAELVRSFVAHNANGSLMGEDFMANFPDFFERLWEFSETWTLLVLGLPSSVGAVWPKLRRATEAQREMLACVREFHAALETAWSGGDPGPRWRRLDTVGDMVKARMELYRARGTSLEARTSNELGLVWSMTVNSTMLVFWMVYRIASSPSLLSRIRAEVAPFLTLSSASSPDGTTPRLEHVDVDGLCAHCPLLKAAYVESLRIDNTSWGFKRARQDLVLTDKSDGFGGGGERWVVPKGAYAYSYEELQHSDPRVFPDPLRWNAERHLSYPDGDKTKVPVAKMGIVRPYGAGPGMCPGRNFALNETMLFPAVILSLYDITPVGGGDVWTPPKPKASSVGVKTLLEPYPAWVRRRNFTHTTS